MMRIVFLVSCILFSVCLSATAQSCANYNFASSNQDFSSCSDLPYLNSHLHWKYSPSAETVQIAFRCTGVSSSRWVAWAINPTSHGMVGSQALVAYRKSDGTVRAYTSPVTSYQTGLQEGDLSFPVSDLTATYSNNEIIIFATLKLQNISSSVNQVWQEGLVSNDSLGMHPVSGANVQSMGTLNLLSGESGTTPGAGAMDTKIKKKNVANKLSDRGFYIYLCSTLVNLESIKKKISQKYCSSSIKLVELHIPADYLELPPRPMPKLKNYPKSWVLLNLIL